MSTRCAASSLARMARPYSSARAGNVAACDARGLVQEHRPGVGGRPGELRLDDPGAERLEPPDPCLGGVARLGLATVREVGRRGGGRRCARRAAARGRDGPRAPTRAPPRRRPSRHRADGVERRAEREDAVDRDDAVARLEPDDLAGGGGQPDRAAGVRADRRDRRGRRRSPRRCRSRSPPSSVPAWPGCAPSRTTRSCRARPTRTRRGSPCRRARRPAASTRSTTVALRSRDVVGVDVRAVRGADPLPCRSGP